MRKLAVPRHCFLLLLLLYLLYLLGNLAWQELLGGRQEVLLGGQELAGQEEKDKHLAPVISITSVEEGTPAPIETGWLTNNTEVVLWIGQ